MLDIFLRACRDPFDYGRVIKCHDLEFFATKNLGNGTHEFTFTSSKPLQWKAGQHGIFSLPDKKIEGKSWRVFSVASAPHENSIKIATIIPPEPSDFKQKLLTLEPGEAVSMRGPIGDFYVDKEKTVVGVAGGIGITPFRSLFSAVANGDHSDVTFELIYGGKDNYWAYEEELREWSKLENINIHFLNTPDEINSKLDQLMSKYNNEASYFIAGSPGMIGAIKSSLQEKGIKRIVNDPFKGY